MCIIFLIRVEGMLKAGGLSYEDRPIWFTVYKAFPPQVSPSYHREACHKPVVNILYPEDLVRA